MRNKSNKSKSAPRHSFHRPPELGIDALWRKLRVSALQPAIWADLARAYSVAALPWQAAYVARQAVRLDATLAPRLKTLSVDVRPDAASGDAVLGRASWAHVAEQLAVFERQLRLCPGDWLTWLYVARLQEMGAAPAPTLEVSGALPATALGQAIGLEPLNGESLHWLGVWRLAAGNASGAVSAFAGLLNIQPMRHGSMMYLGEALLHVGNLPAAEKAFARASQSNNPDFLLTLSNKVFAHNYWTEAKDVLQKALSLRPGDTRLLTALAKVHWDVYELTEARVVCEQLLQKDPHNKDACYMLAALPGRMGDAKGHLEAVQLEYEQAKDPLTRLASSIAMASLYHDGWSEQEVFDLHRRLCKPIEDAVKHKGLSAFKNDLTPHRRLRIGYVTGDLHRQHPVNIFMLPVLQRFNHAEFEICVYHTGVMHDEYTRQAKACADRWLEAAELDDLALQRAVVADQVDILVDLAGHTSTHRLGVFAMRAAPVQATFLGYPHSTGLHNIDWLVGDATVSPPQHPSLFSEGLALLPHSVFCWAPVDNYPLPPPRGVSAPVVFGSFNNAMKLSPKTVALWARVLKAVPQSELLLKAPSLRDATVQARFAALFAAHGIGPERLQFRGPSGLAAMMQEYGDIDIALDPTPYNGGTTTLQALWMGVPVVCLTGANFVSRMGASFLRTLNRSDWLADDEEQFVSVASALARACTENGGIRSRRVLYREQMAASPLCDIGAYVKDTERLLRAMWVSHVEGRGARVITHAGPLNGSGAT